MSTDTAAPALALRLRFPRKGLVHIEGFAPATTGGGNDMGSHVSYAPESHCAALTRGAIRMNHETRTETRRHADDPTITPGRVRREQVIVEHPTAAAALAAAEALADRHGGSVCSNCRAAATR